MTPPVKCFHCDALDGAHTEVCPTHKKGTCPPHRKGLYQGDVVCVECKQLWDTIPQLYCIAYEYRATLHVWRADFMYLHAVSDGDARIQFLGSQSPHLHMRIVGIAPVLGYLVDDAHGEELTA